MNFDNLSIDLKQNFAAKFCNSSWYTVEVVESKIWEIYLSSFPVEERATHICNNCRRFLRDFGGLVTLDSNYNMVSIWDFETTEPGHQIVVNNLRDYVMAKPISNVFLTGEKKLGVESNFSSTGILWKHLALQALEAYVDTNGVRRNSRLNESRNAAYTFDRALKEFSVSTTETVLDLIEGGLYRGAEYKGLLESFLKLQKQYANLKPRQQANFAWAQARSAITGIRGTVIGTLMQEIQEGKDEDAAIKSFESKVSSGNFNRPSPIVTESAVAKAKQALIESGYESSLSRRFATPSDLDINNMIFIHRPSALSDVFAEIALDVAVNINSLRPKVISREIFLTDVVPTTNKVEVLLEASHENNMFSLITAVDHTSLSMMKWDNSFSWYYSNGVADSIAARVRSAGGKTEGRARASLAWDTSTDLDLHNELPGSRGIYHANRSDSKTGGTLDVDAQVTTIVLNPVENIVYPHGAKMPLGRYPIKVHNYRDRTPTDKFTVEIVVEGKTFNYNHNKRIRQGEWVDVGAFVSDKDGSLTYEGPAAPGHSTAEFWNLQTNRWINVLNIFKSPNYWGENKVGNEHLFLHLEGAVCSEKPRAFFNEFLKPELIQFHKKFLEVFGSKLPVAEVGTQVSGLGFSSTADGHFICRVNNQVYKVVNGKG